MSAAEDTTSAESRLTAAGRVLAVLDVFRTSRMPVTLSEISRSSGLSMTTAHRLTHELLDWEALEKTSDGRYRLGTKMLELVTSSGHAMHLRERALPWLVRLHQTLRNVVVHLSIRDRDESVYVECLRSGTGGVVMNRLGGRMPLHATATGRVLLAFSDLETQDRILSRPLRSFTPETVTDPEALRRELAAIRATGSITTVSQVTYGTIGVAAPVLDRDGKLIAAVGIVVAQGDHQIDEYGPLVKATAGKIARELTLAGLTGD